MSYAPRSVTRNNHWQPGEVLPSPTSASLSSQGGGSTSFESSLGDEDMQLGLGLRRQSDTEKLWDDVQYLVHQNFERLQGNLRDMSRRMEQMEEKLGSIQALVDERFSDCPLSGDTNRASASGSSHKRKRKTPVSLQKTGT